jgi:large subunit ribosomal protein L13
LTGNKERDKVYYHHTGYPGGIKGETVREVRAKDSRLLIEYAVRRMLPQHKLAKEMIKKLHVYPNNEHPYEAQKPEKLV